MKKRFLMATLAIIAINTVLMGQGRATAVLQHGSTANLFQGANSLQQAIAAAVKGDAIYLTSGVFTAADIDKAIAIFGAGYVQDKDKGRYITYIIGDFSIDIPEGDAGLHIEGIWNDNTITCKSTLTNATFKCNRLRSLIFEDSTYCSFVEHCRINSTLNPADNSQGLTIRNSVIETIWGNSECAMILLENCVIEDCQSLQSGVIRNSIIVGTPSTSRSMEWFYVVYDSHVNNYASFFISEFAIKDHVIDVDDGSGIFGYYGSHYNYNIDTLLFGKTPGIYSSFNADSDWHLTESAASTYLGSDGTQLGIYGGSSPFTDIPSNPQVTSCDIAPQTDNNNRLSVKITVEAQQQ